MKQGKLQTMGLMLALSLILSYIESQIPMPFGVPGMKLGLSNLMVVLLLYVYGSKEAVGVNLLRIILSGFMFGGLSAILFSLSGALFSFAAMFLAKKSGRFGIAGISLLGGVFHNAGQLIVAAFMVRTYDVMFFIPPLMAAGAVTGFVIGLVASRILPLITRVIKKEESV